MNKISFIKSISLSIVNEEQLLFNERNISHENNVVLLSVLLSVILIIIARIFYQTPVLNIYRNVLAGNKNATNRALYDDGVSIGKISSILYIIVFYNTISAFIFSIIVYIYEGSLFDNVNSKYLIIYILILMVFFLLLKTVLISILGLIFKIEKSIMGYLKSSSMILRASGILLIPVILLFPFVSQEIAVVLMYIGITILLIGFIIKIIKAFLFSFQIKLSIHYTFLYFCSLEIFPILIIADYFRRIV